MKEAPRAKRIPKEITEHGKTRTDDYFWLREKENPDVIAYLEEENAYTEAVMGGVGDLRKKLFEELKGRIKEDDVSAPYRHGDFYYYVRTEAGKQYPIFCRKHGSLEVIEEIILDENEVAVGHPFVSIAFVHVSPDHSKLAYAVDFLGNEKHVLHIKDLTTGVLLPDTISDVDYSFEWANDSKTFFYTVSDALRRPCRVLCHELGTDCVTDRMMYEDADERFSVGLSKTRSERFICIVSESKISTEVHLLSADDPTAPLVLVSAREQDHEYVVDHHGDELLITTNKDAKNFKLVSAPVATPSQEHWKEVMAHREDVLIEEIDVFKDFYVVHELADALTRLRVCSFVGAEEFYIDMPEAVYAVGTGPNPEFDTHTLRLGYSSLTTPGTVYDFDIASRTRTKIKQQEVLGGYDPAAYVVERTYATADDGTNIPISLAYKKGAKTGNNPCWLYGYGSYGISISPSFSSNVISLLDRGFVFAIAHIRGGGDGGRLWYENGKYLKKKNTFTDFIACAEHLIAEGYGAKDKLVISGRSAGGLLMGAVANMRPELFRAVIAGVPFVDVINTMMDPTIPLTVTEYEEWGNPNEQEYYDYMISYAPYENLEKKNYPNMLVTSGLNDTRVQYWEPTKWVAKLRANKTDENLLLLKTNMGAGHGGASGRYDALHEVALEYAFALRVLGISE